ncbi:MAG: hypothetical protein E4H17_03485 [Gemmatimonadales bacterium]|nr:MAG: hypothetical protein E4H17_03485 [Gemmatimonadales bacterium]
MRSGGYRTIHHGARSGYYPDMPKADPAQWSLLFEAANTFRVLAPWTWMDDSQVFGVVSQRCRETAWCVVLGLHGEVFGLAAYLGAAGFHVLDRIRTGKLKPTDDEIRFGFPCLLTSFEDRQELETDDVALVRSTGMKFRGRNAWPQFRSHRRGWCPWLLDRLEVEALTEVTHQATAVCARLRDEPNLLSSSRPGELFVREGQEDGSWVDRWMVPEQPVATRYPIVIFGEEEAATLRKLTFDRAGTWEADLFYAPTPARENRNDRPYYPVASAWADRESGLILSIDLQSAADDPDRWAPVLVRQLLALAREHHRVPEEIQVQRSSLKTALAQVTEILGCRLTVARRLPAIQEMKKQMSARFTGF